MSSFTIEVKTQCARPVTSDRSFDGRRELSHGFDIFFADAKSAYVRVPAMVWGRYTQSTLEGCFPFCTP